MFENGRDVGSRTEIQLRFRQRLDVADEIPAVVGMLHVSRQHNALEIDSLR